MNKSSALSSALVGAVALITAGCTQTPRCQELGSCGGPDPVGSWVLAPGYGSCNEDLYVSQTDPRLVGAEVPAARVPAIDPALWDWCDSLVTSGGTHLVVVSAGFVYSDPRTGSATVRFKHDGTFSAGLTVTGTYLLDFPALCMREFGGMDGRAADPDNDPNGAPVNICKQLETAQRRTGTNTGAYFNTTCDKNPSDPQGCLCAFDLTATGGPSGLYQLLDSNGNVCPPTATNCNTLQFLPQTTFPQKATFCMTGDSLELTGTDGAYLFDNSTGLRTLKLKKVVANCTDGAQGPGEDGVDCGGDCPNACAAAMPPATTPPATTPPATTPPATM